MWTKFPMFDPEVATLDNATITPEWKWGSFQPPEPLDFS
jgi:hypothetical protein